jgi:hypothetical protein
MKTLNEQISRIKQIMNINEDESNMMALWQQDTEVFNQEADENLTVEEYKAISCEAQSDEAPSMELGPEIEQKIDQEGKSKLAQIIEKMKRATPEQLKEEKRKLKQALASKNATDMQEQGFLTIIVFGVPLGWALFLAVAAYILASFIHYMIKSFLNRNPNRRRNCTDPIL